MIFDKAFILLAILSLIWYVQPDCESGLKMISNSLIHVIVMERVEGLGTRD